MWEKEYPINLCKMNQREEMGGGWGLTLRTSTLVRSKRQIGVTAHKRKDPFI